MAGSTGKTFFAALAVEQIEPGKLDLDAPISKYLGRRPWFARLPNAKDITVRHLMTHTSGLVRYEMNPKFTADLRAQPDKVWTPEEEDLVSARCRAAVRGRPGVGLLRYQLHRPRHDPRGAFSGTSRSVRRGPHTLPAAACSSTRVVPSTSRRIPGLVNGYAGPARSARLARRSRSPNGQFVDQPAVRVDRRRIRDEPARPRALGARALRGQGAEPRRRGG